VHDVRFLIRTAAELPASDAWLGRNERARGAAMRFPHRRADFVLGRFAAHELLASLVGPGAYDVRAAADGAPEPWRDGALAPALISLSHRSGTALCAGTLAPLRLGADLERVEPRSAAFVADFFTRAEAARVAATGADRRDECTALIWSAKESVLKALRQGLRLDTRSVELRAAAAGAACAWSALELDAGGEHFTGWWRRFGRLLATVVADSPFALAVAR